MGAQLAGGVGHDRTQVDGAADERQPGFVGRGQRLQVLDRRDRRRTWSCRPETKAGVGDTTSLASPSSDARSTVRGVRSSWATSATMARRRASWSTRASAMRSRLVARSTSSRAPPAGPTRRSQWPEAMSRATPDIEPKGRAMRRENRRAAPTATRTPSTAPAPTTDGMACRRSSSAERRPPGAKKAVAVPTGRPPTTIGTETAPVLPTGPSSGTATTTAPASSTTCIPAPTVSPRATASRRSAPVHDPEPPPGSGLSE